MKLFKIAALFLLSISTHAALAGEITPYSQAEFINFDTDTALLQAYNVRVQSALIVLTGKQEVGRSVADTSREGIERLLNKVVH